jgi:hypothetical protein
VRGGRVWEVGRKEGEEEGEKGEKGGGGSRRYTKSGERGREGE